MVHKQQRIRLLSLSLTLWASACSTSPPATPHLPEPEWAAPTPLSSARIHDRALPEISGLAASRRHPGILWVINDSGQPAVVHALDLHGRRVGRWPVAVDNRDWESLDIARIGDRDYLVIADIGDNLERHRDYRLHFVAEPVPGTRSVDSAPSPEPLVPWYTLQFRYPDGSHNAEAMAVSDGAIYILDKQRRPGEAVGGNQVFRLPLPAPGVATDKPVETHTATALGPVNLGSREPGQQMFRWLTGIDSGQPTGLAMTQDQRQAFVLTYRAVLRFERREQEPWASAFRRTPEVVYRHRLRQAEAVALDATGRIWLTSEGLGAPLQALPGVSASASRQPVPP